MRSFLTIFLLVSFSMPLLAQIQLLNFNSTLIDFDNLGNSSTANIPNGFSSTSGNTFTFASGVTNTTQAAGTTGTGTLTGTSAGGFYNFANGINNISSDRALGFLTSNSFSSPRHLLLQVQNSTNQSITGFNISFDYEKYRSGTRAFDLTCFYSFDQINWIAIANAGHAFSADANNTTVYNPPQSFSKNAQINTPITSNTVFYIRFTLTGVGGSSNGQAIGIDNIQIQAIGNTLPSVALDSVSHITDTSLNVAFSISQIGNNPITNAGTIIDTQSLTLNNPLPIQNPALGSFNQTRTNLIPNTVYFIRAFAANQNGTAYSQQDTVTTLSLPVQNLQANQVQITSLNLQWQAPTIGNASIFYELEVSKQISFNIIEQNIGQFNAQILQKNIDDLLPNTNYYFRVRVINTGGASTWQTIGPVKTLALPLNDTINVMFYNLLHYGNYPSFCPQIDNDPNLKDGYLTTIMQHANPDLLAVVELGSGTNNANRILNNVLANLNKPFSRATSTNPLNSFIVNMLYFNNLKWGLSDQFQLFKDLNYNNLTRNIDIYKLYYKDLMLSQTNDTTFLFVIVLHAKAGSTQSDQNERALETAALMQYIQTNNIDKNILLVGDFNARSHQEQSIQHLINWSDTTYRFKDPINQLGNWYNNQNYAHLHTQATRTNNTNNGCFASGGMDDRFDIAWINNPIFHNTQRIAYVSNSYKAIGQDGNRLNGNLLSPNNQTAPAQVINALYENSDHLPIFLKLSVNIQPNPLPVTWFSFKGEMENNNALLLWETKQEKNNHFFEIQRSINGYDFYAIGNIMGAGNSSILQQ